MKIVKNIINHPSKTQKYGDLKLRTIVQKLTKCEPALKLLFLCGFKKSENNKRLIWSDTNNNIMKLRHIKIKLSMMLNNSASISKVNTKEVSIRSGISQQTANVEGNQIQSLLTQQISHILNRLPNRSSVKIKRIIL